MIASTPTPPYYAVILFARRTDDAAGYAETAARMRALAAPQPGYLGMESADGWEITVSYWRDLDAIRAWKAETEHHLAQQTGRALVLALPRARVPRRARLRFRALIQPAVPARYTRATAWRVSR